MGRAGAHGQELGLVLGHVWFEGVVVPVVIHSQILRVHGAAVAAGLATSRSALLAGLPQSLVVGLSTAANPGAQVLNDLDQINESGRLADGTVPLQTWLSNAVALSGPRAETTIFQQVLELAKSSAAVPVPIAAPLVLVPVAAADLRSIFLSYGEQDEAFVKHLEAALRQHGVATSLLTRETIPDEKIHRTMHERVKPYDRVILICSRSSLDHSGVQDEIKETLAQEERDGDASYLIPIALDDYMFAGWSPPDPRTAQVIRDRVVANFHGADTDPAKFEEDVTRLVAALGSAQRAGSHPRTTSNQSTTRNTSANLSRPSWIRFVSAFVGGASIALIPLLAAHWTSDVNSIAVLYPTDLYVPALSLSAPVAGIAAASVQARSIEDLTARWAKLLHRSLAGASGAFLLTLIMLSMLVVRLPDVDPILIGPIKCAQCAGLSNEICIDRITIDPAAIAACYGHVQLGAVAVFLLLVHIVTFGLLGYALGILVWRSSLTVSTS
jgi:hypothetical protein